MALRTGLFWSSCPGKIAQRGEPVLDRLAPLHGRILLAPTKGAHREPSGAVAEIVWGNTQVLAEYADKVALIGEATFGGNQFQREAAALQQALGPLDAPRKNIRVRGHSEISLEFAREVVAAQSGKTRQIVERDVFRKILVDELGHHSP